MPDKRALRQSPRQLICIWSRSRGLAPDYPLCSRVRPGSTTTTVAPSSSPSSSFSTRRISALVDSDEYELGTRTTMIPLWEVGGKLTMLANPRSAVMITEFAVCAYANTAASGRPCNPTSRTSTAEKPACLSATAVDRGISSSTTNDRTTSWLELPRRRRVRLRS